MDNNIYKSTSSEDGEIDLGRVFSTLNRNKRIIIGSTLLGLIFSTFSLLITKRTWKGDFQIVLSQGGIISIGSQLTSSAPIAKLAGAPVAVNKLDTEVAILSSPSILMDVYNFVVNEKSSKSLRFEEWRNSSLTIETVGKTTILGVEYRDNNKDLILPVLNKISSIYQGYSEKKRVADIDRNEKYYKKLIDVYQDKNYKSSLKAQEFASKYNLIPLSNSLSADKDTNIGVPLTLSIEKQRNEAFTKLKYIDEVINKFDLFLAEQDTLGYKSNEIVHLVSTLIPEFSFSELTEEVVELNKTINEKRVFFKDNSTTIQDLLSTRRLFLESLINEAIAALKIQKVNAEVVLKLTERPEGVIAKYKKLLSESLKDERILDNLESANRVLSLDRARSKKPWDLITVPTLYPYPVAPAKKKTLAVGLFMGLFTGSAIALIYDRRRNIIFDIAELNSNSTIPLLAKIPSDQQKSISDSIELLASGALSKIVGNVALLHFGDIDELKINYLRDSLDNCLKESQIIATADLREANKCSNILLITSLGITEREKFFDVSNKLSQQNKSFIGLLAFN